jgi:glucose-6-phosphate isomerase
MNVGNGLSFELGKYQQQVERRLVKMEEENFVERLWKRDETLWIKNVRKASDDIALGWMDSTEKMLKTLPALELFAKSIYEEGFKDIVLLGMGGSSLAPYVFQKTFAEQNNGIKLTVLDSTEPETIKKLEAEISVSNTLFIVSSKSGTTAEVMAFFNYFFHRVFEIKGDRAGENFIAITDVGSPLVQLASKKKFRTTFTNLPDIGGRFSALSYFGLVPAALIGVNVKELLERTLSMISACRMDVPIFKNPGVVLGVVIAEMAMKGRDKLTYLTSDEFQPFGLWLEQLIAESTGKYGRGILPLKGSENMDLNNYGKDRCFLRFGLLENNSHDEFDILAAKGSPVIKVTMRDVLDLGQEFFRWEIATATAGAILGINPFDQPNVEESKKCTKELLSNIVAHGNLPEIKASHQENGLQFFNAASSENASALLETFFSSFKPGDYVTFHAYMPEEKDVISNFNQISSEIEKSLHAAVSTQFGPRYLHSTGQYHKGGPETGFFIQFTCCSSVDIRIPELPYTFGTLKRAQAFGDMEALKKNNRRVILVDLGEDYVRGLSAFLQILQSTDLSKLAPKKAVRKRLKKHVELQLKPQNNTESALVATMVIKNK